jgi:hypothetical protein
MDKAWAPVQRTGQARQLMPKTAALVLLAVLAASLATACGQRTTPAAANPAPSSITTPTPTPISTRSVATPSDPLTFEPSDTVVKSKLYKAGRVPTVRCPLPRPDLTSKAGMVAYARVLVTCMDTAWAPLVERSDAYLVAPEVFTYSRDRPSATPECADPPDQGRAFYHQSGLRAKICFQWEPYLDPDDPVAALIDFQQMLAHEYGHHVQQSVGIMTWFYDSDSKAGLLEDQRRMELQASCLGAAFMGANQRTFRLTGDRLAIWQDIVRHSGDEYNEAHIRDHGSRSNHGYWTIRAFGTTNPASCNTFTAPAKRVS